MASVSRCGKLQCGHVKLHKGTCNSRAVCKAQIARSVPPTRLHYSTVLSAISEVSTLVGSIVVLVGGLLLSRSYPTKTKDYKYCYLRIPRIKVCNYTLSI